MTRFIVTAKPEVPRTECRQLMEEFNAAVKDVQGVKLVNYFPRFVTSVIDITAESVDLNLPEHVSNRVIIRPEYTIQM